MHLKLLTGSDAEAGQHFATPQRTEINNINNSVLVLSQLFQKIEIVENKINAVLSESQKKSPSPKIEEGKSKKEVVINEF